MGAQPDDQQPPQAHKAWFAVWKTHRKPEAARRAFGDWLARQRDRDPFQPRLLPNGTLLYPPGVKLIPLHEPPTPETGETAPNTFRQGALPADPSVRQRIGAMLGEQDYARFGELRETVERLREQLSSESGLATTPTIRDQGLFAAPGADAPAPAPHFRIWPGPLAAIFGEETRAQIARRAAVNLAALAPLSWRVNARGPDALDDLGFVRICVQAALDWNPTWRRPDWVDPIADAFLPPSDAPHRRHNPNTLADLCAAWGLQKVDLKGRRAGDIILYPISAHGAACGILIDRREPTQGPDRVALMALGKIPEIHARHGFDQIPCAALTWPEEA